METQVNNFTQQKKVFAIAKYNGHKYKLILNIENNSQKFDYDQQQLQGKLVHLESNFLKYEGQFYGRKFHGKGIYYINQTDYFNGIFDNGFKVQGILVKNGCTYIGKLKNDKPQGYGQLQFSDGSSYFGGFDNGQLSGKGEYKKIVNGVAFVSRGQWIEGKREGIFSIENIQNRNRMEILYQNGFIQEIKNVMGNIQDFGFENEVFLRAIKFSKVLPSFNVNEVLYQSNSQQNLDEYSCLDNNQYQQNKSKKVLLKKQIMKSLYKLKKKKQQIKNFQTKKCEDYECSICLEKIQNEENVKIFPCQGKHLFHQQCIDSWLQQKFTCPECRHDLTQIGLNNLIGDGKDLYIQCEISQKELMEIEQNNISINIIDICQKNSNSNLPNKYIEKNQQKISQFQKQSQNIKSQNSIDQQQSEYVISKFQQI